MMRTPRHTPAYGNLGSRGRPLGAGAPAWSGDRERGSWAPAGRAQQSNPAPSSAWVKIERTIGLRALRTEDRCPVGLECDSREGTNTQRRVTGWDGRTAQPQERRNPRNSATARRARPQEGRLGASPPRTESSAAKPPSDQKARGRSPHASRQRRARLARRARCLGAEDSVSHRPYVPHRPHLHAPRLHPGKLSGHGERFFHAVRLDQVEAA